MSWPAYLELHRAGELEQRAKAAERLLEACRVCPRECLVQRLQGETGVCGVADQAMVSSYGPHFGEERPLVGVGGSGTIFLAHCNLCCVFCQNFEISQQDGGRIVSTRELAGMMLDLQRTGCHNINFVTPTHQVPQILRALPIAVDGGLRVPLAYNCGGYESLETLRLLNGVVDIYMPDFKYADVGVAKRYSKVENYPEVAKAAFREMHRQVGDLTMDGRGTARRGLLVRHLVLPNDLAGTGEVVRFLAGLSKDTYLNIMDQYRPCYRAHEYPALARRPTRAEFEEAFRLARDAGLHRLDGYC
ncbi:MAG: radical SAM protein [candidate division NC10 bacterium RIFCSPLOWO2_02_FULL_66_22]|nr:MAG: radical SAM protein [candidate division NC10 bacterium RIFCSPLOWO2_02_FULL_66_22]